jgi:hypothetical protein
MSQHYGANGGDPKKLDSKHIVMDFEILAHLAKKNVISDIQSKLDSFVEQLQSARNTGMLQIYCFSHKHILKLFYLQNT